MIRIHYLITFLIFFIGLSMNIPAVRAQGNAQITVTNNCPFAVWSQATNAFSPALNAIVPIHGGSAEKLTTGESVTYSGLPPFVGGRVYGYYKDPGTASDIQGPLSSYNQFVEMAIDPTKMNYNISYVDWAALPVSMKATGGSDCQEISSNVCSSTDWYAKLALCPTEITNQYNGLGTCMSSFKYCEVHPTDPKCHKLDYTGYTTEEIFGGLFVPYTTNGQDPLWDQVAAWNRGTFSGDANPANYYQTQPYNDYAAWIHKDLGATVYGFSTDDHQNQGGFIQCTSTALQITWCPCESAITPVDLLYFNAVKSGESYTSFNWATASEHNTHSFEVERSIDGKHFEWVTSVPSRGNSSTLGLYSAYDTQPHTGTWYFRLRQLDLDGASSYSSIVSVHYDTPFIGLYPNPSKGLVTVSMPSAYIQQLNIRVTDLSGRSAGNHIVRAAGNDNKAEADFSYLASGTYILYLYTDDQSYSAVEKLVIY